MQTNVTLIPPVINGLRGAFKQPEVWGRNDTGYWWDYHCKGTAAEIQTEAHSLDLIGAEFIVTQLHGGMAEVRAQIATAPNGAQQVESFWELDPNEVEKDLLSADFPHGTISAISADEKKIIKKAIDDSITLDEAKEALKKDPDEPTLELSASAESIYRLMLFGATSFPVEASVIRNTQIVSSVYTVAASANNVNRIYSTATLIWEMGAPPFLLFGVPESPTATQFIETAGDLVYGWRKIRARVSRINYLKWQICFNYQFGLWAKKLYGEPL